MWHLAGELSSGEKLQFSILAAVVHRQVPAVACRREGIVTTPKHKNAGRGHQEERP